MPVVRALTKLAKKGLLAPVCGCQGSSVAVRHVSFSPRQVTSASDASFHSVSFSETDHPKVLITGMTNSQYIYHCLNSVRYSIFTACFFFSFLKVASGN